MGPWILGKLIRFGEIASKHFGIAAINKTGGTLTKGTLVYVSGWDTTTGRWKVSKAVAGSPGVVAHYATGVVMTDVANDNSCTVRPGAKVTGLNTSGKTVGDAVYLDVAAGAYTYTAPATSAQMVGIVTKVDATDGSIEFDMPYLGSFVNSPVEAVGLTSVNVTLSPAQIILLRATPITLIPAPGVGNVIELVEGGAYLSYGTAAYVGANNLQLKYKDGTGAAASEPIPATGFLAATVSTAVGIEKISTGAPVAKTVADNQPMVIHNVGASELTTGDSPIRIRLVYRVVAAGW
jgi:hypothetical protein